MKLTVEKRVVWATSAKSRGASWVTAYFCQVVHKGMDFYGESLSPRVAIATALSKIKG